MLYNINMNENGIIEVFARCVSCGRVGATIRRIEKYANKNNIMFSKHKTGDFRTPQSNLLHINYLKSIGMPEDYKIAVVVENGNKVTPLSQW